MADNFANNRADYEMPALTVSAIGDDPVAAIGAWVSFAEESGEPQPNAMGLATVDALGRPSLRTVLLKSVDAGLVFYTNYNSRKGDDIAATGRAALCLTWLGLHRQVRASGLVTKVSPEQSDAYFASRPRGAQLAAAASAQSAPLADRAVLEEAISELDAAHPGTVPRPEHWGGYRLSPDRIEFWQGRRNRLHDRFEFSTEGDGWSVRRLAP